MILGRHLGIICSVELAGGLEGRNEEAFALVDEWLWAQDLRGVDGCVLTFVI